MITRMDRRQFLSSAGVLFAALATGPVGASRQPLTGRDVIVLLPGISGSVLSLRGEEIWSPSVGGIARALISMGQSIDKLRLSGDSPTDELDDGVVAERLVPDIHLLPGLWKIDGYTKISRSISSLPGVALGRNFFEFPYDWRRDNRYNAKRLAESSRRWLREWRRHPGMSDAKLVFVAHSMGGLIARYFIECMEGWKETGKLITFGTPFRGSPKALSALHQGQRIGSYDIGPVLRSFTSVYQLLPTYGCVDVKGELMRVADVEGIENVDLQRVSQAARFHEEVEQAAAKNAQTAAYVTSGFRMFPIVGISQKTTQHATAIGGRLRFSSVMPDGYEDGDGTVPRPSATPVGMQQAKSEMYLSESHGSLQNSPLAISQVMGLFSEGLIDWEQFSTRSCCPVGVGISVDDAMDASKDVVFEGRYDSSVLSPRIRVEIEEAYSQRTIAKKVVIGSDEGRFSGTFPPIDPGAYRIVASFAAPDSPDEVSVTDLFVIF